MKRSYDRESRQLKKESKQKMSPKNKNTYRKNSYG